MPLAAGGALDDATFLVNIVVAAGTVGATVVALWLGLRAEGEKKRERNERALLNASRVIAVPRRDSPRDLPLIPGKQPGAAAIEVLNASDEVVTDLRVQAAIGARPDGAVDVQWEWHEDTRVQYLLPNQSNHFRGGVHRTSGFEDVQYEFWTAEGMQRFDTTVYWRDGHGIYWERANNGEPRTRTREAALKLHAP